MLCSFVAATPLGCRLSLAGSVDLRRCSSGLTPAGGLGRSSRWAICSG